AHPHPAPPGTRRHRHPHRPPRVEYELTALGESLRGTVYALARWVTDHNDEIETARHHYDAR
ncbi:winged helix-turn-helix transcriptional regulator, partial [Streptomyces sp. NBS 14/10]|uniref:winged helix-turn-helix transcriptional regulator n=1 Tax=Streptomyces sp. NBS 14/10 TaxID=1945643 RepID=UPI00351CCAB8